jgi:hypothetical protein
MEGMKGKVAHEFRAGIWPVGGEMKYNALVPGVGGKLPEEIRTYEIYNLEMPIPWSTKNS